MFGHVANLIAIETYRIDAILCNVVSATASPARFDLVIMVETHLEFPKAHIAWNTATKLDAIVAQAVEDVSIALQPSAPLIMNLAVPFQTFFNSHIGHLIRCIVHCQVGQGGLLTGIAISIPACRKGCTLDESGTVPRCRKRNVDLPGRLTLEATHRASRDVIR